MMLSLLLACGAPEPAAAPSTPTVKPRPDIVVVLAPGLRADVPGIPGAEASFLTALGRTPGIDEIAGALGVVTVLVWCSPLIMRLWRKTTQTN